ncbi:MAG: hypothetical protein ACE5HE_02640 [Phycisphaerae bacterium]
MLRLKAIKIGWIAQCLVMAGCATTRPPTIGHSTAHLTGADRATAFAAAENVLTGLGYRVDKRDASYGILLAHPSSGGTVESPPYRPVHLSSSSSTRDVAEVHVEQVGSTVSVSCKVLIQEQTTQAHRLMTHDQSGGDAPTETPIDRDAATTAAQNTVWRTLRRDIPTEREILTAITDALKQPE